MSKSSWKVKFMDNKIVDFLTSEYIKELENAQVEEAIEVAKVSIDAYKDVVNKSIESIEESVEVANDVDSTEVFEEYKAEVKEPKISFYTMSRSSIILEDFVGKHFYVYNGRLYKLLVIKDSMVGHKLGEFVFTKKMKTRICPGILRFRLHKDMSNSSLKIIVRKRKRKLKKKFF